MILSKQAPHITCCTVLPTAISTAAQPADIAGRYMYLETFGRWHAIDLFFGLAYLSRRATSEYPAADIAAAGQAISGQQLSAVEAQRLLQELRDVRRYMLYCQGLRHHRPEQQKKHWHDLVGLGKYIIWYHSYKGQQAKCSIDDKQYGVQGLCMRTSSKQHLVLGTWHLLQDAC